MTRANSRNEIWIQFLTTYPQYLWLLRAQIIQAYWTTIGLPTILIYKTSLTQRHWGPQLDTRGRDVFKLASKWSKWNSPHTFTKKWEPTEVSLPLRNSHDRATYKMSPRAKWPNWKTTFARQFFQNDYEKRPKFPSNFFLIERPLLMPAKTRCF